MSLQDIQTSPIRYSVADAAISELCDQFAGLTIQGVDDAEGFEAVRAARLTMKRHRVDIEKTRKTLKADALEYGRQVDGEAKRLTGLILPTEERLKAEEDRITQEKAEQKAAAELERRRYIDERCAALASVGEILAPSEAEALTEEEFAGRLTAAAKVNAEARAARAAREAEEAAVRKALEAKLEEERAELAKLRAEKDRVDAEAAAEREAAEQARAKLQEIEGRQRDEQLAREQAEAQAKIEAERQAIWDAQRPAVEKVLALADAVDALEVPDVAIAGSLRGLLAHASGSIRNKASDSALWFETQEVSR